MDSPLEITPQKRPCGPESNSAGKKSLIEGDDEPAQSPIDIDIKAITEIDSLLILSYMKPTDNAEKTIPAIPNKMKDWKPPLDDGRPTDPCGPLQISANSIFAEEQKASRKLLVTANPTATGPSTRKPTTS